MENRVVLRSKILKMFLPAAQNDHFVLYIISIAPKQRAKFFDSDGLPLPVPYRGDNMGKKRRVAPRKMCLF